MKRNHTQYLEMASAYVDEKLSSHEKKSFEHHCEKCKECRAALQELQNLRLLVSEHGDAAIPSFFMTRLHGRLKEETNPIDPWVYEAKKLLPLFSFLAVFLFLIFLFRSGEEAYSSDDYYLGQRTSSEQRVLTQKKAFTTEEIFVLAMTQEGREE